MSTRVPESDFRNNPFSIGGSTPSTSDTTSANNNGGPSTSILSNNHAATNPLGFGAINNTTSTTNNLEGGFTLTRSPTGEMVVVSSTSTHHDAHQVVPSANAASIFAPRGIGYGRLDGFASSRFCNTDDSRTTDSANKNNNKGTNSHTIPHEWFVSEVPSHFLCCVCHEVPLEPLQHKRETCSVLLCKSCRQTILNKPNGPGFAAVQYHSCPQCRQGSVSEFTAMNRVLRVHYFEPLQLRCQQPLCQQVITIGSYVKHRDMDCVGLEVVCPIEGCGTKCSRGRMAEHIYEEGLDHVQEMMEAHYCLLSKSNGDNKKSDKASVSSKTSATVRDPSLF